MSRLARLPALLAAAALTLAAAPSDAHAQSLGDRLKKKAEEAAKRKAEQRTEKRAGEATDKALDKVECAASDKLCQEKAAGAAASTPAAGGAGAAATGTGGATAGASGTRAKVGEGAWLNYDFKPGDRPLFIDDFSKDEVGDFPRRLELIEGNMEVAQWNGMRLLRGTSNPSTVEIKLSEPLPERFTLELDMRLGMLNSWDAFIMFGENKKRTAYGGNHVIQVEGHGGSQQSPGTLSAGVVKGNEGRSFTEVQVPGIAGTIVPLRVMADGRYVKVYVHETRVGNMPNADLGRTNSIVIQMACSPDEPCYLGNIRLMAGGKKLYDALSTSGRVATQGIYFDTGSDRLRPESTPTLKEIGQMLTEHADLKLTIEGHTDNVGDAAANLDLSTRRAKAVAQYLVEKHGIDAARLKSAGFGDKKPIGKNDSAEGRQQNRRVELVKG